MDNPGIVNLLKTKFLGRIINIVYREEKDKLHDDYKDIDDDLMISQVKAYIVKAYEDQEDEFLQDQFMNGLRDCAQGNVTLIHILICSFIKSVNSLKSKVGDHVNRTALDELKELEEYKNDNKYKQLSKYNNKIAIIIKEYYLYHTMKELREDCINDSWYGFSEDELKIIEATKNHPLPNQIAHLIYDYREANEYKCNHEISGEKETLKKLLVNTKNDNPPINIIFDDGTIVYYDNGDIRIRPYKFKHILRYTKLYATKNFDWMNEFFDEYFKELDTPERKGKQMIINSFFHSIALLTEYEEIYTKKMIDDSKNTLVKVKEIARKYDL